MTKTSNAIRGALAAGVLLLGASAASAQVIGSDLMVANGLAGVGNPSFLQRYSGANGQFLGSFLLGGPQNGAVTVRYGMDGSLYVGSETVGQINRYNPNSGAFINTVVPNNVDSSARFAFGTDGNLYFLRGTTTYSIERVNAITGAPVGTFVSTANSGLVGAPSDMTFGPDGHLYVANGDNIRRYDGVTGAPLGAFVAPGSGGLTNALALQFLPDGSLLASNVGTVPGNILHYDGTTGAFLGVFASGNGLSVPYGMAIGPDGLLYVASKFTDSILRFNATTGGFVDTFVAMTAGHAPTFIAFTPTPIPEPPSLVLAGFAGVGIFASSQRYRAKVCPTTCPVN